MKYINILSDKLIKNVFKVKISPFDLYNNLSKIKNKLRNRVAHRENIIKYNIMKEYYSPLIQLISFINTDIAKYVDSKCEVKIMYNGNKQTLDSYSKMCYKLRNKDKK